MDNIAQVCLVVDQAITDPALEFDLSTVVEQIQPQLTQMIQQTLAERSQTQLLPELSILTNTVLAQSAQQDLAKLQLLYPLTLNLPAGIAPGMDQIYQRCRDVASLRRQVSHLGYQTGAGNFWLPIVLTPRGPLYGEVIGIRRSETAPASEIQPDRIWECYCQPMHFCDQWRQPLYQLALQLLRSLAAPPATYLLQFGLDREVCFDRLWPFPAKPAIASLGVQIPDLFTCHWLCLAGLPVTDLVIPGTVPYEFVRGN